MAFNLKMYPLGSIFADFILKFNQMNEYFTKKKTLDVTIPYFFEMTFD